MAPNEIVRLKSALEEESPLLRDFFWLSLLTAARRANMLAMEWSEIDFDLATWVIPHDKFKNGSTHTLPLTGAALAILAARKETPTDSRWVFPGTGSTGHIVEPKRAWARVVKRAGIQDAHIHDLRRTLASYMAMQGENPYVIAKMLGHKDLRSTAIYARLNMAPVRQAAESVSESWHNLLALLLMPSIPTTAPTVERVEQSVSPARNATVRLGQAGQILVEAKILLALRSGARNKKQFHQKIGGRMQVNGTELARILAAMELRKLILKQRSDSGEETYLLSDESG